MTLDKMVQPAVLSVLMEGPLHGYLIAQKIAAIPDFVDQAPDVSGIYRFLKNLEARGLVVSDWSDSGSGHAKRLFTITDKGIECLKRWKQTLRQYRKTIDSLLNTVENMIETVSN
ncbi:MAG: PadR family transcriptional regulator [Thermoguttaceae bacterium]